MITDTVFVGFARHPNKTTGDRIYCVWQAVQVPVRVCEGGGWYSHHPTEKAWDFLYRAHHKHTWGAMTASELPIEELVKQAILDVHERFCIQPLTQCRCKRGYVSMYDGKCGYCRTKREREIHRRLVS